MLTSIASLPNELLRDILLLATPTATRPPPASPQSAPPRARQLATFSSVNRQWRSVARPELYRRIFLEIAGLGAQRFSPFVRRQASSPAGLVRLLLSRPPLAALVREVEVGVSAGGLGDDLALICLLDRLPNLVRLILPQAMHDADPVLLSVPSEWSKRIRVLTLHALPKEGMECLSKFSVLEELALASLPAGLAEGVSFLRLKALSVGETMKMTPFSCITASSRSTLSHLSLTVSPLAPVGIPQTTNLLTQLPFLPNLRSLSLILSTLSSANRDSLTVAASLLSSACFLPNLAAVTLRHPPQRRPSHGRAATHVRRTEFLFTALPPSLDLLDLSELPLLSGDVDDLAARGASRTLRLGLVLSRVTETEISRQMKGELEELAATRGVRVEWVKSEDSRA
ncbi:hypothetical protein JCM6882_003843 [Rhodosporidiobolus microsporus]